jgi:hypothetical protein
MWATLELFATSLPKKLSHQEMLIELFPVGPRSPPSTGRNIHPRADARARLLAAPQPRRRLPRVVPSHPRLYLPSGPPPRPHAVVFPHSGRCFPSVTAINAAPSTRSEGRSGGPPRAERLQLPRHPHRLVARVPR